MFNLEFCRIKIKTAISQNQFQENINLNTTYNSIKNIEQKKIEIK